VTSFDEGFAAFLRDVEKAGQRVADFTRQTQGAVPRDPFGGVPPGLVADIARLEQALLQFFPPAPAKPRLMEPPRHAAPATPEERVHALQTAVEAGLQAARRKGGENTAKKYRREREARNNRLLAVQARRRRLGKTTTKIEAAKDLLSKERKTAWKRLTADERTREAENFLRSCRKKKS